MLFSSSVFLFVFLPCVLLGYYVILRRSRLAQNVFLLIASLFFYAWGEPWFVLVMIASIAANYGFGRWVGASGKSKKPLVCMLIFNLFILYVFKYLNFTVASANELGGLNLTIPGLELPIGISFFTFQAISYVIDVYRGKGEAQSNPLNVGLYIAFFPQLIAGPIVKYETVAHEIQHRKETWDDFSHGICRFAIGLSKKVLLANTLAIVADDAFAAAAAGGVSTGMAWLGTIAYMLQILFDFSGYSDMAIGMGRMFGFHFLENFRYPYLSRSLSEYWTRWHISLGTWFREYVYYPLGGSKVAKWRQYLNIYIVWILTGIWHGANWTFLVWGIYYGTLLTLERVLKLKGKGPAVLQVAGTIFCVHMGTTLFRSDSLAHAWQMVKAMFGFGASAAWDVTATMALRENWLLFLFALLFCTPVAPWLKDKLKDKGRGWGVLAMALLLFVFVIAVSYIVKGSYNPFIYFNF